MAIDDGTQPPQLEDIADTVWARFLSVTQLDRFGKMIQGAIVNAVGIILGGILSGAAWIGVTLARSLAKGEDRAEGAFGEIAAAAVEDMFGVSASQAAMTGRGKRSQRAAVAADIGDMLLHAFSGQAKAGDGGEIGPSDQPAKNFLSAMTQLALEGWLEGWLVEALSIGQLETFGDLDDTISHVLGLGRASAAVHGPLVRHMIVNPLEWKILREHRPTPYSTAEALELFARGAIQDDELAESLAREGYGPRKIANLKLLRAKYLAPDDALMLARERGLGRGLVVQAYRNQGFDEGTAELATQALEARRLNSIRDNALSAITRAYVAREISDGDMRAFLATIVRDDAERQAYEAVLATQRSLNIRQLSQSEVINLVEEKIFALADYRRWLEAEGYAPDDAFALELLQRARMDRERQLAQHRAEQERERAAAKAERDAAAAARAAEVEAARALGRRGPVAELRRAVVRGQIPFARLEEVLAAEFDPDTVAIYRAAVEADRLAYMDEQERADAARQRAGRRNIELGQIETAVLEGVLTLNEYAQRLTQLGFPADDARILVASLTARKAQRDEARAAKLAAERAAGRRRIDLGRAERLVRRGLWTMAQYDRLLAELGFDEPARISIRELLTLEIADDAKARQLRDEAAARGAVKGLTLEQMRRAVVTGTASDAEFQTYLINQGFTSDAQAVLLAEVRRDVADAEAARQRRADAEAASAGAVLSLSRVAQAARLGFVSPDAYVARLIEAGYSDDDIAIELELLLQEIADAAAARGQRERLAAGTAPERRLSLAELEAAVKAGAASIDDYAALAGQTYAAGDAAIVVSTLRAELAALDDARRRRVAIDGELAARTLSLGDLETAVKAGALTLDDYNRQLVTWGYGAADADLLTQLLFERLNRPGAAG